MTMPHERMRSLRWGWEFLQALQTDPSIPRAATLAQTYPTPQSLITMLQADRPQLPEAFGESVDGARARFEEVQFGDHGNQATRWDTLFTLRHFPMKGSAERVTGAEGFWSLHNWLAPEDSAR
jgi:hypothetical protein